MSTAARRRRGGLSLEAAVILPVVLLAAGIVVWLLQGIEAEIKLKGALDRTAAELSLISPLCDLLNQNVSAADDQAQDIQPQDIQPQDDQTYLSLWLDLSGSSLSTGELAAMMKELWPEAELQAFLSDAVFDLASSSLLGSLLQSRLDYWLDEAWSGQTGWLSRLGPRGLYLDWRLDRQQLWLCLSYQLSTPVGSCKRQIDTIVPLWIGSTKNSASPDGQIWLLDNFTRGQQLRQLFGSNLPADFPVIARFFQGEATAIKSMDLTAPSYRQEAVARQRIMTQISQLAAFRGAVRVSSGQSFCVEEECITSRRLLLIIPENSRQSWLDDLLSDLQQNAAAVGVSLEVARYGNSRRYQQEED